MNGRAFFIFLFDDIAGDLWLDLGVDIAVERGDPLADDGHVSLYHCNDFHFWRSHGGAGSFSAAAGEGSDERKSASHEERSNIREGVSRARTAKPLRAVERWAGRSSEFEQHRHSLHDERIHTRKAS